MFLHSRRPHILNPVLLRTELLFLLQGQTKSHTVFLESSFSNPLKISDIKLHPPDERFVYLKTEKNVTELLPNRRTKVCCSFCLIISL